MAFFDARERDVPPLAEFDLVVVKVEQVRGRDCFDALEQRVWIGRPQERQKLMQRFGLSAGLISLLARIALISEPKTNAGGASLLPGMKRSTEV